MSGVVNVLYIQGVLNVWCGEYLNLHRLVNVAQILNKQLSNCVTGEAGAN